MKNKVKLTMFLFFGLTSLVYIFPFAFVDAAKLESGVQITRPDTGTEMVCDDMIDNDSDGKVDANDEDCAAAPAAPTTGTCGLQIVSGVPINYGQINVGQASGEKIVSIKNEGTSQTPAEIMIKGGDWIGAEELGSPIIFPSAITHVARFGKTLYEDKSPLTSAVENFGQISGGESVPLYFQMKAAGAIEAKNNMFIGSLHQDVTIDLLC